MKERMIHEIFGVIEKKQRFSERISRGKSYANRLPGHVR